MNSTNRERCTFTQFIEDNPFKVVGMTLTRFGDSGDFIPNSAGGYTRVKNVNGKWLPRDEKARLALPLLNFRSFLGRLRVSCLRLRIWLIG
ncbi:hypothetical protein [Spirosoma foliorum]|uniref:Uncharacterized protein n=1 Tax=Spirosoma foliorum TaxID=2710596 RepID=A0A7G5GYT5_9BACT|nr:hypothetical protein [Spirosoma foliorum]QMW04027.1 hypothetical protein H3H32_03460 [Spirosoma foliorum]